VACDLLQPLQITSCGLSAEAAGDQAASLVNLFSAGVTEERSHTDVGSKKTQVISGGERKRCQECVIVFHLIRKNK
jgi:hypothetical protein